MGTFTKNSVLLSAAAWLFALVAARPQEGLSGFAETGLSSNVGMADSSRVQTGSNDRSIASLVLSFEKALSQGETAKARVVLADLLQRPLSSEILSRLGIDLARRELYSDAAQVFTRWAKDYPRIFESHYNLALAYLAQQKYPEALSALEQTPQGSKTQSTARLYLRGKILAALGQAAEAEQSLSAAFSAAPQQENYALDLGLFYLRQHAYPTASSIFSRGTSFHPRSTYLLLGLSLSQFLEGRSLQAVATCRKLLKLDPGFSVAQLLLAFTLYESGEFEDAEKVAATGIAAGHSAPYLYYLHAAALLKLQSKDYDRISRDLAIANGSIPGCTLCYVALSKVHQAKDDLHSAINDLETAVRLDPRFDEAWYHLSIVYGRAGQREDATRASTEFNRLKSEKTNRDTEILRDVFLKTLAAQE